LAQALLAFDTDRIKDYVFATGRLRDIRGASALLDRLNRHSLPATVREMSPTADIIYARGGGALVLADAAHAEPLRLAVERLYRDSTETASITGAIIDDLPDDIDRLPSIQDYYRRLSYRLRAAKDRTPAHAAMTAHVLLRLCEACGDEYASEEWKGPEGRLEVCRSCALKRQESQRATVNPDDDSLWQRLVAVLRDHGYAYDPDLHRRPKTFGDLAARSAPEGYFGLIYADGDDMGRALERLTSLDTIRTFARDVDDAVYEATAHAIVDHLPPPTDGGTLGFDVLFLGGDDLVMVTTVEAAIETALTLVEAFAALSHERLGYPLRMSACVVLAHATYPFEALLGLAESGLRFAKRRRARRAMAPGVGLVNFLVTSGTTVSSFDDYYEQTLTGPRDPVRTERTLRPYTPDELRALLKSVRSLADAPRGKIQQLREACAQGDYYAAIVDARNALLRWPQPGGTVGVEAALASVGAACGLRVDAFPWLRGEGEDEGTVRTPFVDLSDLFDFVAPDVERPERGTAMPGDGVATPAAGDEARRGGGDGPAAAH